MVVPEYLHGVSLPFRVRLKVAVERGVLIGVQWGVTVLIIAACLLLLVGDYALVRQRAANGQAAFEWLHRQAPPAPPVGPTGR